VLYQLIPPPPSEYSRCRRNRLKQTSTRCNTRVEVCYILLQCTTECIPSLSRPAPIKSLTSKWVLPLSRHALQHTHTQKKGEYISRIRERCSTEWIPSFQGVTKIVTVVWDWGGPPSECLPIHSVYHLSLMQLPLLVKDKAKIHRMPQVAGHFPQKSHWLKGFFTQNGLSSECLPSSSASYWIYYGVATISRLLKITCLFGRVQFLL